MRTFICAIILCALANAETLRLSKVVEKAGPDIMGYETGEGDDKQIIFVENKPIVSDGDVAFAIPSPSQEDAIDVTLDEKGTEKMIAATMNMRPGQDRIAILVKGKVISAPVIQSVPLGKNFQISGITGPNEPEEIAGSLLGKSIEEIREEVAERKKRLESLPPPPEPEYHTDEEYAALEKEREKIGLNYMDRLYTEGELDELLSPGMSRQEIEAIFGKPNRISSGKGNTTELSFETAPEKLPLNAGEKMKMDGFAITMKDGKLSSWNSQMWSSRTRQRKPPPPPPSNLVIEIPDADMSSEDFDLITFVEGYEITLKPGSEQPTKHDILQIMTLLNPLGDHGETEVIDSKCDAVTIVAKAIPEVGRLVKDSPDKLSLKALAETIRPYVFGDKELP